MRARDGGFTLVEVVVVLAIVAGLVGMLVPLGSELLQGRRSSAAREQLVNQRVTASARGGRLEIDPATFGFNGDVGGLPDSLPQLLRQGSLPAYDVDDQVGVGVGWRGPYLSTGAETAGEEAFLDPFGRPLRYVVKDTTIDGAQAAGYVESLGADQTDGGGDDLLVPLLESQVRTGVTGFVYHQSGQPVEGAPVTYTFRRDGALADTVVTTDSTGRYAVDPHALGPVHVRSGSATGSALAYVRNSAAAVSEDLNDLTVRVTSVRGPPVTLTSIDLVSAGTSGCPTDIVVQGIDVKSTTTRFCPGDGSLTFAQSVAIRGGTTFATTIGERRFLVRGGEQTAPELRIGGGSERGEATILLQDWQFSNGDPANLQNVTISFSVTGTSGNTSTFTFTVPG